MQITSPVASSVGDLEFGFGAMMVDGCFVCFV